MLDEATSSLDSLTDAIVQRTVRHVFLSPSLITTTTTSSTTRSIPPWTVVTIAHRLSTVLDTDHVVVLSAGSVVEQGAPQDLLEHRRGVFYDMCVEGGVIK